MFKFKNTQGKYAQSHQGINFVKGFGSTWNTRRGVLDAVKNALYGYCFRSPGSPVIEDLIIIDVARRNKAVPLVDFASPEELASLRTSLQWAQEHSKKFNGGNVV